MINKNKITSLFQMLIALVWLNNCGEGPTVAGGTSDQGNAIAVGVFFNEQNQPAPNTQVQLIPVSYNPVLNDPISPIRMDTTDDKGRYILTASESGLYNIMALNLTSRTKSLIKNVRVTEDTAVVPVGILKKSGTIRVPLPQNIKPDESYFYIEGTSIWVTIDSGSVQKGYTILDSVPEGYTPSILLAVIDSPTIKTLIVDSALILAGRQVDVVIENSLPFRETFENGSLLSRNWYDVADIEISTTEKIPGSVSSALYQFLPGSNQPASGNITRLKFTETDVIYISYYVKYSTNWMQKGHREFFLLTNKNNSFKGPAFSPLSVYYGVRAGKPGVFIQDAQNIDTLQARADLTQVTETRAVAGCNGDSDGYGDGNCVDGNSPDTWWNQKEWYSDSVLFSDSAGRNYKGDWHQMEFEFKLNNIVAGKGVADGVIKVWQDSTLIIDINNMMFRTGQHPDMKFNQFVINPYLDSASVADQTYWMDDLEIRGSR